MNIEENYLKINPQTKRNQQLEQAWFSYCQQLRKPCVLIRQQGMSSSLEWDSVTLSPKYDALFMSVRDELEELAIAIIAKYNFSSKISYVISATSMRFSNIPNDSVDEIAEDIFNLIDSYKLEL